MVQTHRAVGGGGSAEVLQIGAGGLVQLVAQPFVQTHHIGHFFHDLHADGRAQKLGFGLFGGLDLDDPGGLAAFVGQQAEVGHIAHHRAHNVHDAAVAVATGTQHRVGIHHGRGLCPAEHIALLGHIAHLIQIAGTGEGVFVHQTQLFQLFFVKILLGVHEFVEHKVHDEVGRHIFVHRTGIHRKLLLRNRTGLNELIHQLIHRAQCLQTEGGDQVVVFRGHGNQLFGTKNFAVFDHGFHDFGQGLALAAVQNVLLFRGKIHKGSSFTASCRHPRRPR